MKSKKFSKKLAFNKETIANLNNEEKIKVKGGDVPTKVSLCQTNCPAAPCDTYIATCNTCNTDCGTCFTNCGTCDTCFSNCRGCPTKESLCLC